MENVRRVRVVRQPRSDGTLAGLERTPGTKRCPVYRVMDGVFLNNKPVVCRDGLLSAEESDEAISLTDRALLSADSAFELVG